jgi:hypothetical protein
MSSSLVIRIVGGVFGGAIGTYLSGRIYEYFNKNIQPIPQIKEPSHHSPYESKYKDVKSFEEILKIDIGQHINNTLEEKKINYEYDNEHGNTFEFKNTIDKEEKVTLQNNTLYDNSYDDFYRFYIELYKDDNK